MGLLTDSACTRPARGTRSSCSPAAPPEPRSSSPAQPGGCCWLQSSCSPHPGKIPATLKTGRQCWGCLKGCGDAQQGTGTSEPQEEASQLCLHSPAASSVQLHREGFGAAWQAFIWTGLTAATILQTSALLHLLLLPRQTRCCDQPSWLHTHRSTPGASLNPTNNTPGST